MRRSRIAKVPQRFTTDDLARLPVAERQRWLRVSRRRYRDKQELKRYPRIAGPRESKEFKDRQQLNKRLNLTFWYGAFQSIAAVIAMVLPQFEVACKKADADAHWRVFKPHCPPIAHVRCPKNCQNHDKLADMNGCHVCDCLQGKKGARGKQPQVASPSGAAKKRKTR